MKSRTSVGACIGFDDNGVARVTETPEARKRIPVVWPPFQEGTGCTESSIRSPDPIVADILLDRASIVGEPAPAAPRCAAGERVLILGVGNILMGDEGVGVHVLRALADLPAVRGARFLDGGTGGVNLITEFDGIDDVVIVDATCDGLPAGTVTFLQPESVGELPRGLGAHDFGLKDLFAAAALIGQLPRIRLYTISVEDVRPMCTELAPAVAAAVPRVAASMRALAVQLARRTT